MTLRKKTLLLVSSVILGLIVILFFVSRSILLERFAAVEEQETRKDVERVLSALSQEFSDLETMTTDWASWDDSYTFVEDANSQYIQTNLANETFILSRLNLVMFINSSGQTVFGKAFDLNDEKEILIPPSLREHLSPNSLLLTHSSTKSGTTGIILLPEGPMLVASEPILTSKGEGPIRGTLIFGRYLSAAEIERLGKETLSSLVVKQFTDPLLPPDFQLARSSLSEAVPMLIRPLDKGSIAGYTLLKDIYGEPSLMLRLDIPRDEYEQGQISIAFIMLAILGAGLVLGAVTTLVLEKQVLSRLSRLSKNVSSVSTSGDMSARVPVTGTDELASLANNINEMLAALQNLYDKEARLRQELETEMRRRVDFTRALVHELKTPLTPVLTSSDMLITELKQEPLLSMAKNISRGAIRLNSRIDELLDLAKGEIGTLRLAFTRVEPLQLLREAVDEFAPVASRHGQSLKLDLPPSLSPVRADENRLRQVVVNLLNNACKFTPEGGKITVRAKESDTFLTVEVQDTGPGLADEEQQRLFQPYYRSENDRQRLSGLGLGLALCKTLVELHGGKIWVQSSVGEGSTFGFSVPLGTTELGRET